MTGITGYHTPIPRPLPPITPFEPPAPHTEPPRTPSIGRRLIERFALIAFALYHLPLFINNYPSLGGGGFNDDGLAPRWGHIFTPPGVWVARHILGVTTISPSDYRGDNGDVAEEFGRLLLCVVLGAAISAAWTYYDRRKVRGSWVPETLRVLLRYSIALGLLSYGVAKLLPQQFPPLSPRILGLHVGDLTPMSLLWTFMEYSRSYALFGGIMECVAVVLLCYRRTATLGALVCLGVMTNVALLNWDYGVPVKLYATMLVVSSAVLVLYDLPRLWRLLVANKPAPAASEDSFFHERVPTGLRWAIKLVLVGSVTISSFDAMLPSLDSARRSTVAPGDTTYRLLRSHFHLISD